MKPEAFLKSIDAALCSDFDIGDAVARTTRMAASLPHIKLYHVTRKGKTTFYKLVEGSQIYVAKSSDEIYLLARRRYLLLLAEILKLRGLCDIASEQLREKLFADLHDLINTYAAGNLDLARIVMSPKQYKWYTSSFRQKGIDTSSSPEGRSPAFRETTEHVIVRSKSERDIMNSMHSFAVPVHYEEERSIIVQPLVDALHHYLLENQLLNGRLFYIRDGVCYWRVPKELDWMNAPGSIWKTYNPRTGRVYIYNDFKILLSSGEEIIWEHHGMCYDFTYRNNAGERVMVLKYTRSVPRGNLIETFEFEVDSPEKIEAILRREVLPRLWF